MAKKASSSRKRTPARRIPGAPLTPLIYIHGIGRQEPEQDLRYLWDLALLGNDGGSQTRMAYWADILRPPAPTRRTRALAQPEDSYDAIRSYALAGIPARTSDRAAEFVDAILGIAGAQTPGAAARTKVLPLPAFLRRPLTRAFLKAFVRDAAAYFYDPKIRDAIRGRFHAELPAQGPFTIIAHSLGSVIAFDVLTMLARDGDVRDVAGLVTIGSPLGIREIQDQLERRHGPRSEPAIPDGVRRWDNLADPLDPVALDKSLANDFEPGGFIRDHRVINQHTRHLAPHAALGYLSHPTTRKLVARTTGIDPMGRFLVARDVTAAMVDPTTRHPVLIEALQVGYPAMGETSAETAAREAREGDDANPPSLHSRIQQTAARVEKVVAKGLTGNNRTAALEAARVDPLKRFVAAHLTPIEMLQLTREHADLGIYRVWKSASKAKLIGRSPQTIQADAAWSSYAALGKGIEWAVLDTGIQGNHPHFRTHATVATVWDCTKVGAPRRLDTRKRLPTDADGHGTHVAGIIAGEQQPSKKAGAPAPLRGMAPLARLHIYKVLDDDGAGEDAWIIKALDHIAERNANGKTIHGLNLSLGGPFDHMVYGCGFSPICVELRRLWREGTLVVVACGNEGRVELESADGALGLNSPMSIGDPANLQDCIAVGSVNADKPLLYGVSWFSSRGPTADGRPKPDVVAPGEAIRSCNAHHSGSDPYLESSGTSMAAPHVSGLLAAFLSARRQYIGRPDETKALLLRTCTDLGRDRQHQGHGLPNLMKMLLEA